MALQRLRVIRLEERQIFYVQCIERISISRAPANGMVMGRLWQIYNIGRLRGPVPWANKSIGIESAFEMNSRHGVLYIFALCMAAALAASPARAQTRVGEAAVVKNEVVRVMASATSQINVGDGVLRDEIVRTGLDSAARLVMADSTNLSLGPSATVKLDRTVFNDEHTYRDIAIRLTTGAFRFVTGHSEKAAYKITTSVATIGVRGTILDILSQRSKTTVVLQEGASHVCTTGGQCIELTQPGDTAVITSTAGRVTIQKTNNPPWTFAGTCGAAAGLCSTTQFADATPTVTPPVNDGSDPTGMLCGR
jgi:FecR protein